MGILQPVDILQTDGDLPVLGTLSPCRFPLNDILVEDMPVIRAHFEVILWFLFSVWL